MTSEALAVVRTFFELTAADDEAGILEHLDPDVVWFGTRGGLDGHRVVRGPDAFLDYLREVEEPWERFEVEIERLIEVGDTVVAFMRETAQASRGNLDVQNETAAILKVRERKIVEVRGYLDRDEALRAAGLKD
jgi:ketosteroid isomerase-like protein